MKFVKYIALLCLVVGLGYFGWSYKLRGLSDPIEDVSFQRDYKQIDDLFHQGDNWYWMICNAHQESYSVEYMLKNKSSYQYPPLVRHNDLITKVYRDGDKVIGFIAYYPHSLHVWQFLFLIVDQDYRGKGIAKSLLRYAVDDMVSRGAIKIILYTRLDNIKAQNLYKGFGFKQFYGDEEGVWLSWYKQIKK